MIKSKYAIKGQVAFLIFISASLLINVTKVTAQNLVPAKAKGPLYNYFCTWAAQNYLYDSGRASINMDSVILNNNAFGLMNERWLTGKEGWLNFYKKVHSDLIFLLDEGYNTKAKDGMEIDPSKFPSLKGSPAERQIQLSKLVLRYGWGKLGLWSRGIESIPETRERVMWAKNAGVGYWKIDGGDEKCIYDSLRNLIYPELVIEHAIWPGVTVFNNGPNGSLMAGYGADRVNFLENTDVVRIYDIDQPIGQITGLARVAGLLAVSNGDKKAKAIINCEDLVTVGAGLGCSYGIFRFPITGKRPQGDPDIFNAGPRQTKKRMDEVVRAVRWQRIAPPFASNAEPVIIDNILLTDQMTIKKGETWDIHIPSPLIQSAPARITRGLPLPEVKSDDGYLPFVIASKNPDGAVTIATLGRFSDANGYQTPPANISLQIGAIPNFIGVFGYYKSLILHFKTSLKNKRILGQDLAGNKAIDITHQVIIGNNELILSGSLISKIGLHNATPGDLSDPGLVIAIR